MKVDFFQSIYQHPLIQRSELEEIMRAHEKVDFKKNSSLLQSGKIAHEYYLVEQGLLRAYIEDFKGNEITTDFFSANDIAIEVSSLFQRLPTKVNITALKEGTAWKIDFAIFQELYHKIEGFSEWGRAWMSGQLFSAKQRSIEMHTKSATERYKALINEKPEIVQSAPVKHIASFLGVTDTSLSRIRKEITME